MKTYVVLSFFHFVLVYFIFPIISPLPSLNEKRKKKPPLVFIFQKSGKFWSISLVYFINHKPLIFEEWHIHSNTSLFKRLNFYLQKKTLYCNFLHILWQVTTYIKRSIFWRGAVQTIVHFLSGCTFKQMLRFFIRKMVLNSTFLFL